jgi:hypothetical protein
MEHIDNPRGYAEGDDARRYHPALCGPVDVCVHISLFLAFITIYFPSPENWKLTPEQEWKITSPMVSPKKKGFSILTAVRTRSLGYIPGFSPTSPRKMYPYRKTKPSIRQKTRWIRSFQTPRSSCTSKKFSPTSKLKICLASHSRRFLSPFQLLRTRFDFNWS